MRTVRRVVTSRAGGVSAAPFDEFNLSTKVGDDPVAVTANRDRLAAATGVAAGRFVWADQVHGSDVCVVTEPSSGGATSVAGVDGLVTRTPGVVLAVLSADCVSVLAADDVHGVAGAAHAGWRGSAKGIADSLVGAMLEAGAVAGDIDVLLGPAICGGCYEVDSETFDAVVTVLPASASATPAGTPSLDLRAGLRERLLAQGVRHVTVDGRCTREDPGLFSFRRDRVTGRQAGLAWVV